MELNDSSEKILIVDDEAKVRSVLMDHLENGGSECQTSSNAFDALNKIRSERFSLIISDVMMPGMSGMELLRLVKKKDPETAFIMITGLMDRGIGHERRELLNVRIRAKDEDVLTLQCLEVLPVRYGNPGCRNTR